MNTQIYKFNPSSPLLSPRYGYGEEKFAELYLDWLNLIDPYAYTLEQTTLTLDDEAAFDLDPIVDLEVETFIVCRELREEGFWPEDITLSDIFDQQFYRFTAPSSFSILGFGCKKDADLYREWLNRYREKGDYYLCTPVEQEVPVSEAQNAINLEDFFFWNGRP
jgi:hypothetical protein